MIPRNEKKISLIIPSRNSANSLKACLDSAKSLLDNGQFGEIIYVDDHSSDQSLDIASSYWITCLKSEGRGVSAARNTGLRAASAELVFFLDADCILQHDTLEHLRAALLEPGVFSSFACYENYYPQSLLACLIQDEFDLRYRRSSKRATYLSASAMLVERKKLLALGSFDESLAATEDGELGFRALRAGYSLSLVKEARVYHMHPRALLPYLNKQLAHGYWVAVVALREFKNTRANSYNRFSEQLQLVLIVLFYLLLAPTLFFELWPWLCALLLLIFILQLESAFVVYKRHLSARAFVYPMFSFVRLFFRGLGLIKGLVAHLVCRRLSSLHFP